MTLSDIRSSIHAGRRELAAAVRLVAAVDWWTRNDTESWAPTRPLMRSYRHTDLGRVVFESLSRFSFWTTGFRPNRRRDGSLLKAVAHPGFGQ